MTQLTKSTTILIYVLITTLLLTTLTLFYGWRPNVVVTSCNGIIGTVIIDVQVLWRGRDHHYVLACPARTVTRMSR